MMLHPSLDTRTSLLKAILILNRIYKNKQTKKNLEGYSHFYKTQQYMSVRNFLGHTVGLRQYFNTEQFSFLYT